MKASKTVGLVLVAMVAACSDTVAPRADAPATATVEGGGVTTALSATDTARFNITIDSRRSTTYYLGAGNSITFPPGAICDPKTSSYGVTEWDKPCTAARGSVTVTVKAWMNSHGHARVDFTPNLRFVPSVLPTGWVNLTFGDYAASLDPFYSILYCVTDTSGCYDESKTDLSLLTMRNPVTGKVMRRIKHFSGYNVGAGDGSDEAFNRIGGSGYILVSGRR
ncbi:MAG: hypothetical protein JWM41_3228 [Gemmatimonadetes bacterium]|nr:hypothetical protein [Gemmatimonadota bacterium]